MTEKTPLYAAHLRHGGRMVEFGGWTLPVQYRGVIEEHLAVRNAAGLFDVSHMGEIEVTGPGALAFLQEVTVNDVARLVDGQVQYSVLCYPHGGTVDDITVYRFGAERFLLCVNAANTVKDFAWLEEVLSEGDFDGVSIHNLSAEYGQLALQGPAATAILGRLCSVPPAHIPRYHFREGMIAGAAALISRTGYTGEDGFELYFHPRYAEEIWEALLEAGGPDGLLPAGLGARDTLRLEAAFPLYGHELSAEISPLEAGLGWVVKLEKASFIGREALLRQREEGLARKRAAFRLCGPGVPRGDYPVYCQGRQVGLVTSGTLSPSLRAGIGLALIEADLARLDSTIEIGIRTRRVEARIVRPPFV